MESEMRDASTARTGQTGFSLIELIVAMAITLVVTGAIYGLIAGSQNAFRREPEMAERQQNIRMAMDLIMKDVANAASGLPTFVQAFRPGLDGLGPMGPDGVATDEIEVITNSESRDTEPICRTMGNPLGNGDNVRLMRDVTAGANPLLVNTIVVPFTATGQWTLRNVAIPPIQDATPAFDCTAGNHTVVNLFQPDPTGLNDPANACISNLWGNVTNVPPCELVGLSFANVVRYRIRLDAANVPMLERWSSDAPNAFVAGAANEAAFQTLARGIENMQVQYLLVGADPAVPGNWFDSAPVIVPADFTTLVTQVRVTLAARSEAQNIGGATTSATGGDAIRGSLVSSASPRATLMNITLASPAPILWR
jgi:prepilin-type N-terminal cleavage/methylation domain-containing protein